MPVTMNENVLLHAHFDLFSQMLIESDTYIYLHLLHIITQKVRERVLEILKR